MNREKNPLTRLLLWGVMLLVLLGIVLLVGAKLRQYEIHFVKKTEKQAEAAEKPVPVSVLTVEPRRVPDQIVIPGRIEAFVEADLAAEKGGRIVELNVEKGDRVEKGQVLLRIDDRIWKAALQRAEIEHREATKELERWKELEKAGAVSVSDFDAVQTRKDNADVALENARVQLSQCVVRSPIDGMVDNRYVEQGEYANEGDPVFKVLDIDRVKLVVDVAERDVLCVELGKEIPFRVAVLRSEAFAGKVSFVSALASRESNSFRTEILVDNPGHRLKPGMIAEVSLVRSIREEAIVVPLAAVVPKKGDDVVYVVEGNRVVCRTVRITAMVGDEAVLSSGVRAGDAVVVEGQRTLIDGALVEIIPKPDA